MQSARVPAASAPSDAPERSWREVYLNEQSAALTTCAAEALANGHSVLVQEMLASQEECRALSCWAAAAAKSDPMGDRLTGRVRMPIERMAMWPGGEEGEALCEVLLLRSLAKLEQQAPLLNRVLFGACPTSCSGNPQLSFATGEPAINCYTQGGCFRPHTDKQSLTILLTLSEISEFEGGGTAFYSTTQGDQADEAGGQCSLTQLEETEPTLIFRLAAGSALCFGGQVVHSGVRVTSGQRIVFVASFSRQAFAPADDTEQVSCPALIRIHPRIRTTDHVTDGAASSELEAAAATPLPSIESDASRALRRRRAEYEERVARDRRRTMQLNGHSWGTFSDTSRT